MSLLSRFVKAFCADRLNREIDEEHEFHIASRMDELLADGVAPDEATRRARLEFGSRVRMRSESHDAKLFSWLESTRQDIYYGFRTLLKSPLFAAVAVLTLALGIGVNTAIFSVVNAVLLNPLPYPDANRIVCLFQQMPSFKKGSMSYPDFLDWQRMNRSFSAIAAFRATAFNLSGQGEPDHVQGEWVSAGLFEILHVTPVMGRTFSKEDDRLGANPTVIISESLWRRKFGSEPDIIGRRIILDGNQRTVIGVVPASFRLRLTNFNDGKSLNDVYIPIGTFNEPRFYADRGSAWGMNAIGMMKPDITFEQARQDMARVSRQLTATYPDTDTNQIAYLVPLKEEIVGDTRPVLMVLLSAVFFVLLISCVNVANLLLARSASRQREFAIRLAVGAGQMRIVRQLITESLLLAFIGGAFGLLIAKYGTAAAIAAVPRTLPRAEEIGLDWHILLFTAVVSLLAGTLFGLVPAFKARRANIGTALKETGRSVVGNRSRAQWAFVVVEMAMALVLLTGAGLMIRTLFVLWGVNPGFDPHALTTFSISPQPSLAKENGPAIRAFLRQTHEQVMSIPDVEAASLSWGADPMGGDSETYFWFVGRPKPAHTSDLPLTIMYIVQPDYLKTLRLTLKRGRFLTEADNEHAPRVVVVDETLAQKYFPGRDPVGQYLILDTDPSAHSNGRGRPHIVGVVGHVNQWGLASDAANPMHAEVFLPMMQLPETDLRFLAGGFGCYVRGKGASPPNFNTIRQHLMSLNPATVIYNGESMEKITSESIANKRFTMALLVVFAALALGLASIGIYGVLSYLVGQRTQEIGVRIALGAARLDVLRMILMDGARMTLGGVAIGVAASLGLTHLMSGMLFGVKPTDPVTFVLVVVTLCCIALLACYLPARRAMRVDPALTLRNE